MTEISCDAHGAGKQATVEGSHEVGSRLVQEQYLLSRYAARGLQSSSDGPGLLVKRGVGNALEVLLFGGPFPQKKIGGLFRLSCGPMPEKFHKAAPLRLTTGLSSNPKRLLQPFRHGPPSSLQDPRLKRSRVQACPKRSHASALLAGPS